MNMEEFALLGASMGLIAGVLLYLMSKLLASPQLRRYSIMFILEALLTIVLALALFTLLPHAEKLATNISINFYQSAGIVVPSGTYDHPAELALVFLTNRLESCYLLSYGQLLVWYGLFHAAVGKMSIGGMLPYGPSLYSVLVTTKFFLHILFFSILMSYFLAKLIFFFNAYAPLLIALGIVIRAFEPAKSLGAYLIAVGIGLGLVFPASLNIGFSIFYNPVWCKTAQEVFYNPQYVQAIQSIYGALYDEELQFDASGEGGWLGWITRLYAGLSAIFSSISTILKFSLSLLIPQRASELLYSIVATHFFGPLVAFVISLSFVNIFTTALGGRISEIGRGFFKLV